MGELQRFVADLLEETGAVVEPVEPEGLDVLAPPEVQRTLDVPEAARLGFAGELPPDARRVGLEPDWLDRLGRLLGEHGRHARLVAAPEMPPLNAPERIVEHGLQLQNATWRLIRVSPAWTRYLLLTFRCTALSDEKRDSVLRLGFNLANGSMLDGMFGRLWQRLAERIEEGAPQVPPGTALPADWPAEVLAERLERMAPPRIQALIEPFVRGMRRRFERDAGRLYDYHDGLRREAAKRLSALPADGALTPRPLTPRQEAEKRREEQRLAAIGREYESKIADLRNHYALAVTVEWVQSLDLVMPVQRFEIQVRRRKGERVIALDWNPLTRQLDQAPDEFAYGTADARLVCDEALHLVSPPGLAPCPACGKEYCRACHPGACPKCGHRERRAGPGERLAAAAAG
ncbi:hypothetical protein [Skermanella pratensis]|uniref:hypothetical protein n=1 Tax=Skermanella pratensis TaxID=2233999 RepID=UPI0013016149|nr:hypothetical protein [Skermanella pratensis]